MVEVSAGKNNVTIINKALNFEDYRPRILRWLSDCGIMRDGEEWNMSMMSFVRADNDSKVSEDVCRVNEGKCYQGRGHNLEETCLKLLGWSEDDARRAIEK